MPVLPHDPVDHAVGLTDLAGLGERQVEAAKLAPLEPYAQAGAPTAAALRRES